MTANQLATRQSAEILEAALAALHTPKAGSFLPAIESALQREPANPQLWQVHGLIQRQLDRREIAIASLRRAQELAPAAPGIAHSLARTLFEAGMPSLSEYGRALELAPGEPEIISGMTSALVAAGEIDAAIAGLAQILSRSPLWVEGHKLLGDLRWANGERQGFARSYDAALALHPQHFALRREQIVQLVNAEDWDSLLEAISAGRKAMGELPLFGANEAVCFAELGDFERADRLFAPYTAMQDPTVQVRWIRHLLRSDRPEEASRHIEPWLEHPDAMNFWPYASIAWRLIGDERWGWLEGDDRFVGIYDIADRLPPLDKLADVLRTLHKTRGQPLGQSVRGGSQTDGNLFTLIDPTIVALREVIREIVAEHVSRLPKRDRRHPLLGSPRTPIEFSGAWSVRLRSGGSHSNHIHPRGWFSSAFYVELPEDLGRDESGWLTIGEPQAQLQTGLAPFRTIEPKPGRLVLFPSTMWHGTRPFHNGERLTVAFDVAVPA